MALHAGKISTGINLEIGRMNRTMTVKRGDIYYADLSPVVGSEQGGLRPVLIIQNDVGNRYSPTVIAAAITSRLSKNKLPTHIDVARSETADESCYGLARDSVILLEQIRTLDKRRLKEKMGHLDDRLMQQVNDAITISFGLPVPEPASPVRVPDVTLPTVDSPAVAALSGAAEDHAVTAGLAREQSAGTVDPKVLA